MTLANWQLLLLLEQEGEARTRERKETEKRKQLNSRLTISALTQEAAKAKAQKAKELESKHKMVMKMVHTLKAAPSGGTPDESAVREGNKKKTGKKKRTKTSLTTKSNNVINDVPLGDLMAKEKRPKTKKIPSAIVQQGNRKVPEANDSQGCVHHGLLELLALPKVYLGAYVKEGGWLYKKPCKDCEKKENGNVLDMSTLLKLKGRSDVGYYCNCGPIGHKMSEDEEPSYKQRWTCDMVLCMPCYDERKLALGGGGPSRRVRKRKQLG